MTVSQVAVLIEEPSMEATLLVLLPVLLRCASFPLFRDLTWGT